MLLSTLLTAAAAATLAAAAPLSTRDETPIGHAYTVLGCIDFVEQRNYGPKPSPNGSRYTTLDECLARPRHGATILESTWTGRNPNDVGECRTYRNNGPDVKNLTDLPTTEDGWCASDKGVTAIANYRTAHYIGCYDQLWWYKSHYRPGWGRFKPSPNNPVEEIPHEVRHDNVVNVDYGLNHPIYICVYLCQWDWEAAAITPQGDCVCTNATVGKTAPTTCTSNTWRFYWKGDGPLPRAANPYK